ncbi:MAG: molecular chaperone [Syntrophobacteraceae bacterium]
MKKTNYAVPLILFAIFLLGVIPARAQMSLMVSPIRVDHQVKAGTTETNVIEVINQGQEPTRISVSVLDWTLDRKGNVSFSPAGGDPGSCANWLQLNPTDFRLDPGQTRQVRYSLTVPPEAKEGGYRAAIAMEGIPREEEGDTKKRLSLNGRLIVTLYETVGSPEIRAQFQDFLVTAANKKISFKLTLANQGDVHFRIKKSFITIKNSKGEEVSRVEVPDIPVLPGATRELEFKKEDLALPKGSYLAEAVLDVGKDDFLGRQNSFSVGR